MIVNSARECMMSFGRYPHIVHGSHGLSSRRPTSDSVFQTLFPTLGSRETECGDNQFRRTYRLITTSSWSIDGSAKNPRPHKTHLHVCRNRIRDDSRVGIRIDDTNRRYLHRRTFSYQAEVLRRVEDDDEIRNVGFLLDRSWTEAERSR